MENLEIKNKLINIKISLDGLIPIRLETMGFSSDVPLIILNVTGLITVIKRPRLSEWIQK